MEKRLDGNYSRMLRAILNKSWWPHPTKQQLSGHLPPITKSIKVKRTWHAGHGWRSKDELISDVLLWTPSHGRAKAERPDGTYIQQLCGDTGCNPEDLPEAMDDREGWWERIREIRADGMTWRWFSFLKLLSALATSKQHLQFNAQVRVSVNLGVFEKYNPKIMNNFLAPWQRTQFSMPKGRDKIVSLTWPEANSQLDWSSVKTQLDLSPVNYQLDWPAVEYQLTSFSKSPNSQPMASGHDVIHTPAPFPIRGLLWQYWLSYPLRANVNCTQYLCTWTKSRIVQSLTKPNDKYD